MYERDDFTTILAGFRGGVEFDAPLDAVTSLRIGGPADALVTPADVDDVCHLVRRAAAARVPLMTLGGTNLLVKDGGVRGVVMRLSRLDAMTREEGACVCAEAGARMPALMGFAASQNLSGLEWAAGIPGTVGGAVVMNAGTRLGEMRDCLDAVRLATPDGGLVTRAAADLSFAYRHVDLPAGVVVGARLQLVPASRTHIETRAKDYLQYRKQTQPLSQPNAGSVFKNPPQAAAGRLIEDAGLKGCRVGDAQVSPRHANFLVNLGRARAADMLELIDKIQRDVFRRTGVRLELEWRVVGDDDAPRRRGTG